ncbi:MAG TPA: hypothetical protein VHT03_03255 [Rhizomicrobium sp.]|jgi:hypothetical protein|nr:hypothetical protein [Rhizomicrobium sp.]
MGPKTAGGLACAIALFLGASAMAAPRCARPDEVTAIQAAAIQQQLMVAALTCNEVEHFNAFQIAYGPELRMSDARLERMFRRLYGGGRGEAQYHAYKTRLANHSSMRSIRDNQGYCRDARAAFEAALVSAKPTLETFVSGVQIVEDSPVNSCKMRVRVGLDQTPGVPNVVPRPNPERVATLQSQ